MQLHCSRVGRTKRLELARDLTCEYGEKKQPILITEVTLGLYHSLMSLQIPFM